MINKITPPKLKRVLPRHRLFEQFDRARDTQVIWLSGPAGAVKSTLVASYLSIWTKSEMLFRSTYLRYGMEPVWPAS